MAVQVDLRVGMVHAGMLRSFTGRDSEGDAVWSEQTLQYGTWVPSKDVQDGLGFLVHQTVQVRTYDASTLV